jgi:nucleotide-binding universal stress UspA family protein
VALDCTVLHRDVKNTEGSLCFIDLDQVWCCRLMIACASKKEVALMKRIMLATDFSERSDRALRRAVLLARAHGALLDLVHVVDDDRPSRFVEQEAKLARELLRELSQSLKTVEGVTCDTAIFLSDAFEGIVHATKQRAPALLVIGPHRRHVLKDAFVGTTAERTMRSVDCPVLMVNGPPVGPYGHVLLTTDLSDNSKSALKRYVTEGHLIPARHSIIHVFDVMPLRLAMSGTVPKDERDFIVAEHRLQAMRALGEVVGQLDACPMDIFPRYLEATEAFEIQQAAAELGADLIVMSTRGQGSLARLLLGSVTQQVLQQATVDVMVIPPARVA